MQAPIKTIGDIVFFSSGQTLSVSNGRNEMISTEPAVITVAGVIMHGGEWFYHDSFNTSVLYPESSIVTE